MYVSTVSKMVDSESDVSVAILHDRFPGIGGGETFAIETARVLNAPIYTMYVGSETSIPPEVDVIPIAQQKYTDGLSGHFLEWDNEGPNPLETLSVLLDMTVGHPDLVEYDIILESGPLSKSYVPEVSQSIIHYPHSPPRWLYDLYRDRVASRGKLTSWVFKVYAKLWRSIEKEANDYVDTFVANSELIRDRIERYYGRDAEVVYPPVTGDWRNEGDDGYFVTWSRLAPDKRISLIVEAFTELDERLVVAGDGEQRELLEELAAGHENIEIRGYVDDIQSLVAKATAVIYTPRQEDFGLVGAEALIAGKPLLGVNEGFTRYQVQDGITGHTFEPTVESIRETVRSFDADQFDSETIQSVSEGYRYDKFERGIRKVVESLTSERVEKTHRLHDDQERDH